MSDNKMSESIVPYLCGGTFFTLVKSIKINIKSFSEGDIFEQFLAVYNLNSEYHNHYNQKDANKKYNRFLNFTSKYANCVKSDYNIPSFDDTKIREAFDEAVKNMHSNPKALNILKVLIDKYLNLSKHHNLVRNLFCIIRDDVSIPDNTEFYIQEDGKPVTKSELLKLSDFTLETFLLGVWHFIIMHRSKDGDNEKGRDTIEKWRREKKLEDRARLKDLKLKFDSGLVSDSDSDSDSDIVIEVHRIGVKPVPKNNNRIHEESVPKGDNTEAIQENASVSADDDSIADTSLDSDNGQNKNDSGNTEMPTDAESPNENGTVSADEPVAEVSPDSDSGQHENESEDTDTPTDAESPNENGTVSADEPVAEVSPDTESAQHENGSEDSDMPTDAEGLKENNNVPTNTVSDDNFPDNNALCTDAESINADELQGISNECNLPKETDDKVSIEGNASNKNGFIHIENRRVRFTLTNIDVLYRSEEITNDIVNRLITDSDSYTYINSENVRSMKTGCVYRLNNDIYFKYDIRIGMITDVRISAILGNVQLYDKITLKGLQSIKFPHNCSIKCSAWFILDYKDDADTIKVKFLLIKKSPI